MENSSKGNDKMKNHLHLAYFGSELACQYCNPNCYQNHGMGKSNWCGDENCPMNPKKALEKAMVFFRQVFEKAWCRDTCWHKMKEPKHIFALKL
jgi:hypothetical protein